MLGWASVNPMFWFASFRLWRDVNARSIGWMHQVVSKSQKAKTEPVFCINYFDEIAVPKTPVWVAVNLLRFAFSLVTRHVEPWIVIKVSIQNFLPATWADDLNRSSISRKFICSDVDRSRCGWFRTDKLIIAIGKSFQVAWTANQLINQS